jgi:hypothetical protein
MLNKVLPLILPNQKESNMSLVAKYNVEYHLIRLDGSVVVEKENGEFMDIDIHLPMVKDMYSNEVAKWLKEQISENAVRLNPIFYADAKQYKSYTAEISNLELIERGCFESIIKLR